MSDSEEEFASADEGDTVSKSSAAESKMTEKPGGKTARLSPKTESAAKSGAGDAKPKPKNPKSAAGDSKSKPNNPKSAAGDAKLMSDKTKSGAAAKLEDKQGAKAKGKNSKQKRKGVKNKPETEEREDPSKSSSVSNEEALSEAVTAEAAKVTLTVSEPAEREPVEITNSPAPGGLQSTQDEEEKTQPSSEESKTTERHESKEPSQDNQGSASDVLDQTIERDATSGADNSINTESKTEESPQKQASSGWGGWSSWGTSLVSAATASVSTFTNQVGEGFTTVLETVETTLGAPPPEELLRGQEGVAGEEKSDSSSEEPKENVKNEASSEDANREEGERSRSVDAGEENQSAKSDGEPSEKGDNSGKGGWLSGWGVSDLTHLVSDTSKTFVTGSLDVLEAIGKKTYDALSEHDPGLKAVIKGDNKPNLSSMLRDAKEQAEERSRLEEEFEESRQAQFGPMFDEYQGLAHLEALEMLSNQSENKVQALLATGSPETLGDLKRKLVELKEVFELQELEEDEEDVEHDFPKLITDHLSEFHRGTSPAKLNAVQAKVYGWIANSSSTEEGSMADPKEIHKVSIQSLAELTAKTVEQYHKAGELLLLQGDQDKSMVDRAKALASVTRVVCTEVGILSCKFTKCLNKVAESLEDGESVNTFITNIYLEASNSSTYIQDAFRLLLPVVQQAMLEEMADQS